MSQMIKAASYIYETYGSQYEPNGQMKSRLACELQNALEYHEQYDEFADLLDSLGLERACKSLVQDSRWNIEIEQGSGSVSLSY